MSSTPTIRVVVRIPYNRPEQPVRDPPKIEWNTEKANILWEVIARSRASNNGGTDWKGLAAHLEVPLPYLLYRAQTRYEEDLRGLQDIRGALSPTAQTAGKESDEFPFTGERPAPMRRLSSLASGNSSHVSSSLRLATPLGVRTRLNSLVNNRPSRPKKAISSSTLTLQGPKKIHTAMRPASHSSSEDEIDSEDEAAAKEEEADRNAEEQEALDRKLKDLQRMMTSDTLGLVRSPRSREKEVDRGRPIREIVYSKQMQRSLRGDELSSRSQSVSSASSPQGSIPSPSESQPHSTISRHLSPTKSSSPPAVSPRSARGHAHMTYRNRVVRAGASEQGSAHGSSASSFSDISDTSLSASALESALLSSNIRGTTASRFSAFSPSRFIGRGGVHQ